MSNCGYPLPGNRPHLTQQFLACFHVGGSPLDVVVYRTAYVVDSFYVSSRHLRHYPVIGLMFWRTLESTFSSYTNILKKASHWSYTRLHDQDELIDFECGRVVMSFYGLVFYFAL